MKQSSLLPKTHGETAEHGPVECLGMTFPNDRARREYYLEMLKKKLQDPEFRKIPGFPKGSDENILRLSDPPYYTACPNPFIRDFVDYYGIPYDENDAYHREPFISDVKEGKGGKIYKAHTYHTKVPHEAIARYILHYTNPSDLILDVFAGCGMTGVAAAFCGAPDDKFKKSLEQSGEKFSFGKRRAIMLDLSPFATFLAYNMTYSWDATQFVHSARSLIHDVQDLFPSDIYGNPSSSFVLWSQVFHCPECAAVIVFGDAAITEDGSISSKFKCPVCDAAIAKSKCENKQATYFDEWLGASVTQNEYRPVSVARLGGGKLEPLSRNDLSVLAESGNWPVTEVPVVPMMFKGTGWGDMYRAGYHHGVSHVHHFWTKRNLAVLSAMWNRAGEMQHGNQMRFVLTSFLAKTGSRMHNIGMKAGDVNLAGQIFNTLQIPSLFAERNLFELARRKTDDIAPVFGLIKSPGDVITSTRSAESTGLPDNCIDYVFVDPPFGSNIMYAEMSFLYEAWLGVYTQAGQDAIVSTSQGKGLDWYRDQMARCFGEIFRALKPGRWLTVAFHNSKNEVWIALQEALQRAGFVVADVRILDKGQGTYKQMTTAGAVEKDLAISAYKPNEGLQNLFKLETGTESGVWEFTHNHLKQLPVFVTKDSKVEVIAERCNFLLFDRMVAFHVQHGVTLPMSAAEYYAGLDQHYAFRDEMYFLPEQVAEYDKKRISVQQVLQLELFVSDEASAIQWLKQQLTKKPQTSKDLHPQFLKEMGVWNKHEAPLNLSELLEQSFLFYDGNESIPAQLVSWLKQSTEMRTVIKRELAEGRATEEDGVFHCDPNDVRCSAILTRSKDRWYVPDPNKAEDLEKLRERALLRDFREYAQRKSKFGRSEKFRMEAVRAGFKKAWQDRDYATIITVAEKIPDKVLQGDPKLLMWYDQAVTRSGYD